MRGAIWVLAVGSVLAQDAPSGNAANGRKLFDSYGCYQCHQHEAQGAAATGPRLAPNPVPWAGFVHYVRRPTGQMPPYTSKVATDQALADMYAFLRSIPQPTPAKNIPLLNQ